MCLRASALQRVAGRFRFVETETIACLEGELDETHAVVERMVAGEAHRRVVGVACGSRGKEEVDVRALLVAAVLTVTVPPSD